MPRVPAPTPSPREGVSGGVFLKSAQGREADLEFISFVFITLCHTKILAKCENNMSVISVHLNAMGPGKAARSDLRLDK